MKKEENACCFLIKNRKPKGFTYIKTKHKVLLKYLLFFTVVIGSAQSDDYKKRIDSLSAKSYEELEAVLFQENENSLFLKENIEAYLFKAKKNKDTVKMCTAYYIKAINSENEEFKVKLYDSIIAISTNFKNKKFPTIAYFDKGIYYFNKRKLKVTLDNYLLAIKHNKGNNKEYLEYLINRHIGILKNRIDYDDEALEIHRKCLKYAEKESFKTSNQEVYFSLLSSISHTYRKKNILDSALYYNSIAIKATSNTNLKYSCYHSVLNNGVINYFKKNYNQSFDSIVKGLSYIKSIDDKANMAVGHYYLGFTEKQANFLNVNKLH